MSAHVVEPAQPGKVIEPNYGPAGTDPWDHEAPGSAWVMVDDIEALGLAPGQDEAHFLRRATPGSTSKVGWAMWWFEWYPRPDLVDAVLQGADLTVSVDHHSTSAGEVIVRQYRVNGGTWIDMPTDSATLSPAPGPADRIDVRAMFWADFRPSRWVYHEPIVVPYPTLPEPGISIVTKQVGTTQTSTFHGVGSIAGLDLSAFPDDDRIQIQVSIKFASGGWTTPDQHEIQTGVTDYKSHESGAHGWTSGIAYARARLIDTQGVYPPSAWAETQLADLTPGKVAVGKPVLSWQPWRGQATRPKAAVTWKWTAVAGATEYEFRYRAQGSTWTVNTVASGRSISHHHTYDKHIEAQVRASKPTAGPWSDVVRITTGRPRKTHTVKTTVPKRVQKTRPWSKSTPKNTPGHGVLQGGTIGVAVPANVKVSKIIGHLAVTSTSTGLLTSSSRHIAWIVSGKAVGNWPDGLGNPGNARSVDRTRNLRPPVSGSGQGKFGVRAVGSGWSKTGSQWKLDGWVEVQGTETYTVTQQVPGPDKTIVDQTATKTRNGWS